MSTVLVTGAAGFIGSHTCDQLLAGGHHVIGVDNLRTGKMENLVLAQRHTAFRFHEVDVSEPGVLDSLVSAQPPDAIIHLAALVSVPESIANPALNYRLNLEATQHVAEAARVHRVARVVFASSAAVYGNTRELPIRENSPTLPISPYGAAKLASEALLLGHAAAFGFVVRCHRYFNVYGPRQDPRSPYSGVISIFAEKMRAGLAPTLFGDGRQTRDFVFVADVARANVIAATKPGIVSGMANICTGKATDLNELAQTMRRLLPSAPAPLHAAARAGDIVDSRGDPARAEAELGFRASTTFEAGLRALLS